AIHADDVSGTRRQAVRGHRRERRRFLWRAGRRRRDCVSTEIGLEAWSSGAVEGDLAPSLHTSRPPRLMSLTTDVLVLGSGGAALAAAVTASEAGRKVLVLERDTRLGGTSAISGGALWIPLSRQALAGGFRDSLDDVR